ncbi:dihydrofolate synthase/folylpolyglutamate synthase [Bacillus pakistanensis]|uniref:tetrahydrofolate synthase n=1 Tax=Rossellomorea pakistanensis TaxID=992288 RepID=A0ABS2NAH0_9BACI|nr:folylpolyglutamate synthase/dihydrofolate synthase family protein [Bacillus pakistanensis]MBM7584849.1 dihydrofolate synthase/folylpolyglutamate synthase [Bacillus pakistanensis]
MVATYEEAVNWIHSRLRLGIKPGLKRMEYMMEKLDHPERKLKTIHIGGTNGKGSTVTFLRNILQQSGKRVGTFTSPYFERFNERISINGEPIADSHLVELVNIIIPLSEEMEESEWGGPSEFEVITAMSFYYFSHVNPVDIVIYEVGLGGRLDSTNIIQPLVSAITNIGKDHTQFLGESFEEIAFEKAGIIKEHVPVISCVKQPAAIKVIKEKANEQQADFYLYGVDFDTDKEENLQSGEKFTFISGEYKESYEISMVGRHQIENASLALKIIELLNDKYGFHIDHKAVQLGLKYAYWPGRMEQISSVPLIYLDGAHNPEGVKTLIRTIEDRWSNKKVKIMVAALKDKDLKPMLSGFERVAEQLILTTFDFPRVASPQELATFISIDNVIEMIDWKSALANMISEVKEDEVLVITGSLYFISQVKPYLYSVLRN